jgi:glycosyltransferase involved in cell wall biosynthesis
MPEEIINKLLIRFIGNIPDKMLSRFNDAGLKKNIEVTGYVSHEKSIEFLYNSDILLLVIPDVKKNEGIIPGKVFEYLASKIPILNIGPEDGDAATVINKCKAGKTFGYSKGKEMLECIMEIIIDNVHTGRLDPDNYSRKNLTHKLTRILEENN